MPQQLQGPTQNALKTLIQDLETGKLAEENIGEIFNNIRMGQAPKVQEIKSKIKNQTKNFPLRKRKNDQSKDTVHRIGENICKL